MYTPFRRAPARTKAGLEKTDPPHRAAPPVIATGQTPAAPLRPRRWQRLVAYYRPHLLLLLADLGCAVLVAATALLIPLCASYVTSQLVALPETPEALGRIYLMGGVMLAILAVQVASTFFVDYQGHMMGGRIESDVRRDLFEHCQKLSFGFYDRHRTGQLMSRITNDSLWLGELFHHGPEDITIATLKFVGALAIIAHIDLWMTAMILVLVPFALVHAVHFNRRMNEAMRRSREEIAAVNERVEDSLAGIRVVQSFTNETLEAARFGEANARFLWSRGLSYLSEAWFSLGTTTFTELVTIAVVVFGAVRVVEAGLGVADVLTLLLCVAVLVDPLKRFTIAIRWWQDGYTGFVRAMEILETEPEIIDRPAAIEMQRPRGAIRFDDVTFRYDEEGPHVLKNLSFEIAAGTFVALVGTSGVGKSTLCALIPRFYEPGGGAIRIDDVDIRDVTLASLRRSIGIVQQDVYLFGDTVAANLRYGRPGATDAEIVAAARAANAHDFIMALPQGYETDIGQRGVRLSGGQKQRLTIARAFLKDPAILIFDEATSALDNDSERAIQDSLLHLASGRTTLVIAHRLSTIRHADRILLLTEAGIVEDGPHDALMAAGGVYAGLYGGRPDS